MIAEKSEEPVAFIDCNTINVIVEHGATGAKPHPGHHNEILDDVDGDDR